MKLKHIPNYLSALRLMMIPAFALIFFYEYPRYINLALLIFLLAGATDVLDGYLARRNNWISDLGKLLDPLADKLMQLTVLVCLAIRGLVPPWLTAIFIAKELFMIIGALLVLKKIKFTVMAHWYGKVSTAIIYLIIFVVIFFVDVNPVLKLVICLAALIFALCAMGMYIKDTLRINRNYKMENMGD